MAECLTTLGQHGNAGDQSLHMASCLEQHMDPTKQHFQEYICLLKSLPPPMTTVFHLKLCLTTEFLHNPGGNHSNLVLQKQKSSENFITFPAPFV